MRTMGARPRNGALNMISHNMAFRRSYADTIAQAAHFVRRATAIIEANPSQREAVEGFIGWRAHHTPQRTHPLSSPLKPNR